jgi:hypothetical protein
MEAHEIIGSADAIVNRNDPSYLFSHATNVPAEAG